MADVYGMGCVRCNREIAAAIATMPAMDGYLDTDAYYARYRGTPEPWPKPYVDGELIPRATETVPGDDGWVLAIDGTGFPCKCRSGDVARVLYRGKVELR